MSDENDRGSFFDQLERNEWLDIRDVGRRRYVLRDNVLYWGVPAGVLAALFHHYLVRQGTTAQLYSRDFLFELLVALLIFGLVAMERGIRRWKQLQRRHER